MRFKKRFILTNLQFQLLEIYRFAEVRLLTHIKETPSPGSLTIPLKGLKLVDPVMRDGPW